MAARVAIVGARGQVGQALVSALPGLGLEPVALARPALDVTDATSVAAALAAARPAVVVNASAYTAVDKAEDEAEAAFAINRDGAGHVAAAAVRLGVPVIHYSTDYVFDGVKAEPYREDDATAPLGVYGASKLAGEVAAAEANPRHVILRTAWVCGPYGNNFVKTMMRLAAERDQLSVVADQHGAPTFTDWIARATGTIAARIAAEPSRAEGYGIFHLASAGETTWHGVAEAVMAGLAARGRRAVSVKAIATAEYPTKARRPAHSKLDTAKLARVYGLDAPPWQNGLEACLDALAGPRADRSGS
jgi:dTDP-4-dehydrorhamnose reductase